MDTFGEGIEQQAKTKTIHHRHDHHLVTRILYFQDSLIEMPDVILQALLIFLVDCEEVGSILLPDPVHYGDSGSPGRPIGDNGKIDQHLPEQGDDLCDLRKETNITDRGEAIINQAFYRWRMDSHVRRPWRNHRVAKYGRRSCKYQRMPYGGHTVNVGDVVEMESQGHLILTVNGRVEIGKCKRCGGDGVSRSSHPYSEWQGEDWRDGEWSGVQEDYGEIPGQLSMEGDPMDVGRESRGGCHIEVVNEFPSSPPKESSDHGEYPEMENRPPPEREARIPEHDETKVSTRPGEVAFYETVFHAGLCLPIHPTIRRILHFYNSCPTQLVPNMWRSVVYAVVLWQYYKNPLSLNKFRHLFSLFKNLKPESGWLYYKARQNKNVIKGTTATLRGRRGSFSSSRGTTGNSPLRYLDRQEFCASREGAVQVVGNEGEFHHSRDDPRRGDNSRDNLIEYLGIIRKSHRRVLPRLPDRILLTILGAKFRPLVPGLELSSSSSSLEAWSNPRLPPELRSDGSQPQKFQVSHPIAKGVVIHEKRPRDEVPNISPSKKGKIADDSKGKDAMPPPEPKKKMTKSSKATSRGTPIVTPKEGTSTHPSDVGKLDLDRVISKLFYGVGQVVVLASSLAESGLELRDGKMTQQAQAKSVEMEMVQAQQRTTELEKKVVKFGRNEVVDELRKLREERDATVDGLEKEVAELKKKEVLAKKSAIQEYKSSNDFEEELGIQVLEIDDELALEQEEGKEEEEEEKEEDKEEGKGNTSLISP
ncbi:Transporter MCH1 [Actinidia chinensis var. chinensis]|uniref:Transporter MCH1 n=1 Tax=Actinidia chinensis var. chinensis TaxID=1590841 RepID=A0A2R6QHG6_ACTCC|nr:Transporter MCH1 [Actinidia chinensis var. chinensis]